MDDSIPTIFDVMSDGPPRLLVAGWITAGIFSFVTILIFLVQLFQHLSDQSSKLDKRSKNIHRINLEIIFMIPIFAITSFLSLFFLRMIPAFELVRNLYEAWVLYAFLRLLIQLLGGNTEASTLIDNKLLINWGITADQKLTIYKAVLLQLIFVRAVVALLSLLLALNGQYEAGNTSFHNGYPYMTIVNAISTSLAIIFLLKLYRATHLLLPQHNILLKFASIKLIIGISVLQNIVLAVLQRIQVIKEEEIFSQHLVAELWLNWLLCVEIFFVSLLFVKAFRVEYTETVVADVPVKFAELP